MDLRLLGSALLVAAALVACNNGSPLTNPYPGGAGGNGTYGGGGAASGGSSGGYGTGGSTAGSGTTTGSDTTGSGTGSSGGTSGGTSTGTSGGSSGGSTTGGGSNGNQLTGPPLAFTVASAGQFLPQVMTDGGYAQMEFDMASFGLACNGAPDGGVPPGSQVLALNVYSGSPDTAISAGTYQIHPGGSGFAYSTATLRQDDGFGNVTVVATGQSGQVTWTTSFSGVASGSLSANMSSSSGTSYLSGMFTAPFCGSF